MALPLSGPLSMSMINTELGRALNQINSQLAGSSTPAVGSLFWLGGQSGSIDQNPPHAISEWYGYTGIVTLSYDNFSSADTTAVTTGGYAFSYTPIRDIRGILVYAINYDTATERVGTITYGDRPLQRIAGAVDTTGEPFNTAVWFLGTGIPTGTNDVVITFTGGTNAGNAHFFTAMGVYNNATYDVEVQDSGSVSNDAVNPSITLDYGGFSCLSFVGIGSGLAATSSLTLLTGMTHVTDLDMGQEVILIDRQTSASSQASFIIGYTASSDDVALVAAAFKAVVQSPSPSRTPTISVTNTISVTPSISVSPSRTPTISVSLSLTPSRTPTISISSTPSVTPTRTPTISLTASTTPSITPSRTPTISLTASTSVSVTPTRTPSITPSRTPTISISPSLTPSRTPTISISSTPSVTPTRTLTITATPSSTPSRTPTASPVASFFTFSLGYDTTLAITACDNFNLGTRSTFYSASSTFSPGMFLWLDTALTKASLAGFYSDGTNRGQKTTNASSLSSFAAC